MKITQTDGAAIFSAGMANNGFIGNYLDLAQLVIESGENNTANLIKHNTFVSAGIMFDLCKFGIDVISEDNFVDCGILLYQASS